MITYEREPADFKELTAWAVWQVIQGLTKGESLRTVMIGVLEYARRWEPAQAAGAKQAAKPAAAAPAVAQSTPLNDFLYRYERTAQRFGELWERCQGKGWPEAEDKEFTRIRDVLLPAYKCQILAAVAAAQAGGQLADLTDATRDVLAERQRQITREGYTLQDDVDRHDSNTLAQAAAFYAMAEVGHEQGRVRWPWDEDGCKVKDRYRNFIRASALLIAAADVERLRSGAKPAEKGGA